MMSSCPMSLGWNFAPPCYAVRRSTILKWARNSGIIHIAEYSQSHLTTLKIIFISQNFSTPIIKFRVEDLNLDAPWWGGPALQWRSSLWLGSNPVSNPSQDLRIRPFHKGTNSPSLDPYFLCLGTSESAEIINKIEIRMPCYRCCRAEEKRRLNTRKLPNFL